MRQRLRAWQEKLETFLLEVIVEERPGTRESLVRAVLYVLSKGFEGAIKTPPLSLQRPHSAGLDPRRAGHRRGQSHGGRHREDAGGGEVCPRAARPGPQRRHPLPRLPLQGQPFHKWLLNKLLLRHDTTPPRVVSDGKSLLLDSEMAGDEPYMLASNLKDVVVLVDKDRVKSGRYAIEKFGCDTLLLDDGFQYWRLRGRRQDIVLVDRQQPFGTERLLPRGTLREPPSHLARASVIFITKSDGNTAELRQRIAQFNTTASVIECVHHPLYLEDVFTGQRLGLESLQGRKVASLSGIAQPESFEQSLVGLGAELVYSKRFADHHRFTQQEVLNAINRSKKRQAETIVTTQKDAVRFPKIDRRDLPVYFMRVEIKILRGADDFQDCVRKICFR